MRYDRLVEYMDLYEYYKGVIAFRKAHEGLRFATTEEVVEHLHFVDGLPKNVVAFTIKTDEETLFVVYNGNKESVTIELPEKANWEICIDNDKASADALRTLTAEDTVVEVQPVACLAAVLK
jgi:pullulanase